MGIYVLVIIISVVVSLTSKASKQNSQTKQQPINPPLNKPDNSIRLPNAQLPKPAAAQKSMAQPQVIIAASKEGDCLPEHDHTSMLESLGEGGAAAELSVGQRLTSRHTAPMTSAHHGKYGKEQQASKIGKIPTKETLTDQEKMKQAILWNAVLKRPKFGVLPKDR